MSQNQNRVEEMKTVIREAALQPIDGKITGDVSLFEKAIEPDGLTLKDVDKVVRATVNYSAAAHGVSGEIALAAMTADKSIENLETEFDLGTVGSLKGSIAQEKSYNVAGKTGTTFGQNRAEIVFAPGRTGTPLNAEISGIKALFGAEFGGEADKK